MAIPSDFNPDGARDDRDEGMARADEHANPDFKDAADWAINVLVERGQPFTADEVWLLVGPTGAKTHDNRALGPRMLAAIRDGRIQPTGEHRYSKRRSNHARPLRVFVPTARGSKHS